MHAEKGKTEPLEAAGRRGDQAGRLGRRPTTPGRPMPDQRRLARPSASRCRPLAQGRWPLPRPLAIKRGGQKPLSSLQLTHFSFSHKIFIPLALVLSYSPHWEAQESSKNISHLVFNCICKEFSSCQEFLDRVLAFCFTLTSPGREPHLSCLFCLCAG